jgi:TonB family protein
MGLDLSGYRARKPDLRITKPSNSKGLLVRMSTGTQASGWEGPSRRRDERFELTAPLDVTVLRSGIPDTMPGRAVDFCEGGIAAILPGELLPGETVGVEVQLPLWDDPFRARATVKYQDKLRCGLEFVSLSSEQQEAIRHCAEEAKAEGYVSPRTTGGKIETGKAEKEKKTARAEIEKEGDADGKAPESRSGTRRRRMAAIVFVVCLVLVASAAGIFWWRWNRAWEELESGLKTDQSAMEEKPQAQVPAEVMQKLLIHRVEPAYPTEARKANLQAVIALDIVVGRDGSVTSMRALNGPDVLVRAAMDALRWWKFEPYRLNGEPAVVETTVAVEFKR